MAGEGPNRCTCSFCRRRQAANIPALWASLRVIRGADHLTLYQFGTQSAQHYFCARCGIYTHHRRRTDPAICGINLGCIADGDVWAHDPIPWTDGINHPSDR